MELITIIIIAIVAIIIVNSMMKTNKKELEEIALNNDLNEISKKIPNNIEICKYILNMLGNDTTKIQENINSDATLYIAMQDKIIIGNTYNSFTRIQTIAHECLHSIQDKKILRFNFIYSNVYLLYFWIICILTIFKIMPNDMLFSNILLIIAFIYYVIRVFLENDAMIKAEYVAKEYLEMQGKNTTEEIDKICKGFKELNNKCIKGTNCSLFINIMIKLIIFNVLALIF